MTAHVDTQPPPPTPCIEKRRQPRFASQKDLWREGQQPVRALNMSQNGMFIVTDTESSVGERFQVAFSDDTSPEPVQLELQVMWKGAHEPNGPSGMGMRIVEFTAGQAVYEAFIARLAGSRPPEVADTSPPDDHDVTSE